MKVGAPTCTHEVCDEQSARGVESDAERTPQRRGRRRSPVAAESPIPSPGADAISGDRSDYMSAARDDTNDVARGVSHEETARCGRVGTVVASIPQKVDVAKLHTVHGEVARKRHGNDHCGDAHTPPHFDDASSASPPGA